MRPITPNGGFEHFGEVSTDYALLQGYGPGKQPDGSSSSGIPVRAVKGKTTPVQVLELSTRVGR